MSVSVSTSTLPDEFCLADENDGSAVSRTMGTNVNHHVHQLQRPPLVLFSPLSEYSLTLKVLHSRLEVGKEAENELGSNAIFFEFVKSASNESNFGVLTSLFYLVHFGIEYPEERQLKSGGVIFSAI
jgi:hypothetical protein